MSDDELKVWAERQTEDPRSAAVLRVIAERDRLAAELRWIDDRLARRPALSGTRAERIEKAISVASTADRLAIELEQANNTAATACKQFAEVSAELAELRAACEPIRKGNWPANFFDTMTMQPVIGFRDPPLLGDMRRIAALLASAPTGTTVPHTSG